jgi:hypothetical protein
MNKTDDKTIYSSGDKPPEGIYTCSQCGSGDSLIIVPSTAEELPDCPVYGCTMWMKI